MASFASNLALVTGASSGIGFELATRCAQEGYDLIIASDGPDIEEAADNLRAMDADVVAVQADLATIEGVDQLYAAAQQLGRPVDALFANAGRGLGRGFLDQPWTEIMDVINTNIVGTTYLLQKFVRDMRERNAGRVLITGSIGGLLPGTYQAVYNATKAYLDSFSYALRHELKDTGVTVTCLMPGPTETDFFETADMMDTKVGTDEKDDPAEVARVGFAAMMKGDGHVVTGFGNKMLAAMTRVLPEGKLAEIHRGLAEPGTAKH